MARLSLLVAALAVLAVACSDGKATGGPSTASAARVPVDPELAAYLDQLAPLRVLEGEALAAVRGATGDRFVDDQALFAALTGTALPKYRAFALGLGRLTPPPGPRAALHEKLVVLAGAELAALEALAVAVEKGDGNAVLEINREQRRLAEEMDALAAAWRQGPEKTSASSAKDSSSQSAPSATPAPGGATPSGDASPP